MTLLDPEAAILAGVIGAPLLVLLYFLKLRRRRLRVGSTLLWQRAVQDLQVNEPFRWLKPSILLLLQLLALIMLVIALGRPTIPGAGTSSDRVVIVIDRSASMRALDGLGGTRFDEAVAGAEELVRDLSGGTSLQIISFAVSPRIELAPTTDHSAALRALERLTPTDQAGDLGGALELAETLITRSIGEAAEPTETSVIIFSDAGSAEGEFSLAGADTELRRTGPPPQTGYDNLGITRFSVTSDFDDPSISRVFLRVQNALDREVAATIILESERGTIERSSITIPARTPEALGTRTLTFELDRGFSGLITARINRDDLLEADNAASVIITPPTRPRVMLVTPGGASDGREALTWIVRNALEEMELENLQVVSARTLGDLLEDNALRADLVVFDGVDVPENVPVDAIAFGASLPGVSVRTDLESPGRLSVWSRTHPIMRGLVLDDIRAAAESWFDIDESLEAASLASGVRGPMIVLVSREGHQQLGVSFEPAQSNWPLEISFYLFLAQAVEHLAYQAASGEEVSVTTGERAIVPIESGSGELELIGPVTIRARVTARESGESLARFGPIERAGVYRTPDGRAALSVNMALSGETALTTSDTVRIGGRSVRAGEAAEGRREIWEYFVLLATLLLTIEWFVFAWRMRA